MPSESRTFFDSTKTTSFHISLVASCKLTGRAGGFKINVWRDGAQKRYEFDAENGKQAGQYLLSQLFSANVSGDHRLDTRVDEAKPSGGFSPQMS